MYVVFTAFPRNLTSLLWSHVAASWKQFRFTSGHSRTKSHAKFPGMCYYEWDV